MTVLPDGDDTGGALAGRVPLRAPHVARRVNKARSPSRRRRRVSGALQLLLLPLLGTKEKVDFALLLRQASDPWRKSGVVPPSAERGSAGKEGAMRCCCSFARPPRGQPCREMTHFRVPKRRLPSRCLRGRCGCCGATTARWGGRVGGVDGFVGESPSE